VAVQDTPVPASLAAFIMGAAGAAGAASVGAAGMGPAVLGGAAAHGGQGGPARRVPEGPALAP
jgi:hypothetical protein